MIWKLVCCYGNAKSDYFPKTVALNDMGAFYIDYPSFVYLNFSVTECTARL